MGFLTFPVVVVALVLLGLVAVVTLLGVIASNSSRGHTPTAEELDPEAFYDDAS